MIDRPKLNNINFYPSKSLRRGKPNTIYTGLPQPSPLFSSDDIHNSHLHFMKEVGLSNNNDYDCEVTAGQSLETNDLDFNFGVLTRSQAQKRSSFQEYDKSVLQSPLRKTHSFNYAGDLKSSPSGNIEWENAEHYLSHHSEIKSNIVTGRPSIAKIRTQNAGMVLAKAKLFDSVVDQEKNNYNEIKSHSGKEYCKKRNNTEERTLSSKMQDKKKAKSIKNKDSSCHVSNSRINNKVSPKKSLLKKTESNKSPNSFATQHGKENTYPNLELKNKTRNINSKITNYCESVVLPDGLKETIYDICTPLSEKHSLHLVSPLKDSNRAVVPPKSRHKKNMTPPMKKQLIIARSSHLSPLVSNECKVRKRPMKAVQTTTPRRSPRQQILKSRLVKASI